MQEMPFSLTYGSETVVLAEFLTPNPRMATYVTEANDEDRWIDLGLLEEKRDTSAARFALYKNILATYYNVRVKHLDLPPGDLVLRNNLINRVEPQEN